MPAHKIPDPAADAGIQTVYLLELTAAALKNTEFLFPPELTKAMIKTYAPEDCRKTGFKKAPVPFTPPFVGMVRALA